jgi:two-component system response regulator YesN
MILNVLVVDDEPMIREGLVACIPWGDIGLAVAGAASGAKEALERVALGGIDIVLTDIRMPEADGLELIGHIVQDYPEIVCAILTAHGEFEYAQRAMRLGVEDFVMKIGGEAELIASLKRIAEKARGRKERGLEIDKLRSESELGRIAGRLEALRTLLDAGSEEARRGALRILREAGQEILEGTPVLVCFAQYAILPSNPGVYPIEDISLPDVRIIVFQHSKQIRAAIAFGGMDEASIDSIVARLDSPELLGIGIGGRKPTFGGVHESAAEASAALASCLFDLSGKVCRFDRLQRLPDDRTLAVWPSGIAAAAVLGHIDRALAEVDAAVAGYRGKISPERMRQAGMELISDLYRLVRAFPSVPIAEVEADLAAARRTASEAQNVAVLTAALKGAVEDVASRSAAAYCNPAERAVAAVKLIVAERFSEDLSVEGLAHETGISPNYLSALFKKLEGTALTEFIQHARIEEAKSLLGDSSQFKVYEVAEIVGFKDPLYFSKVFRRIVGMNPQTFRDAHNPDRTS